MKFKHYHLAALATCLSLSLHAAGLGGTGILGPKHIVADTILDAPADGVFNFANLIVDAGKTLTFKPNTLNTPIYILSQGDVLINGTVGVWGSPAVAGAPGVGGPGGFGGGYGGYGNGDHNKGGDGTGPGRGINGAYNAGYPHGAAFASPAGPNTKTYGNALIVPLIGGSGGAGVDGNPGTGGGGGGGAILLGSDTKITLNGRINAVGGSGAGGGSGGSVRLVAPVVDGTGTFDVGGGYGNYATGSQGRVRIDCEDRFSFRGLTMQGKASQGSQMYIFPATIAKLNIIEAAGTVIPVPAPAAVEVTLPAGSSPNRQVKIAATGFAANAPITVVVTPETGPSVSYNGDITIAGDGTGQITVDVVLAPGGVSRIHAWTR